MFTYKSRGFSILFVFLLVPSPPQSSPYTEFYLCLKTINLFLLIGVLSACILLICYFFSSFLLSNQGAKVNWAACSAPSWFFPLIIMAALNKQAELILLYTMYGTLLCLIRMSGVFCLVGWFWVFFCAQKSTKMY